MNLGSVVNFEVIIRSMVPRVKFGGTLCIVIACELLKNLKNLCGERGQICPFLERKRVKRDATAVPVHQDPPPVIGCQKYISSHDRPNQPQIKASFSA